MTSLEYLFDGFGPLLRCAVVAPPAYLLLILLLRVSGKRTLSKWNAFDFVITIAFGSVLATTILSRRTSLAQGMVALGLLVGLQFVVTWSSVRLKWVRAMVKAKPRLLAFRGRLLDEALRAERITDDEVYAALREAGAASMDEVEAVILETDGTLSVIRQGPPENSNDRVMQQVRGYRPDRPPRG